MILQIQTSTGTRYTVRVVVPDVRTVRITIGTFNTFDDAKHAQDQYLSTKVLPAHVVPRFRDVFEKHGHWWCLFGGNRHGPFPSIFHAARRRRLLHDMAQQRRRRRNDARELKETLGTLKHAPAKSRSSARLKALGGRKVLKTVQALLSLDQTACHDNNKEDVLPENGACDDDSVLCEGLPWAHGRD